MSLDDLLHGGNNCATDRDAFHKGLAVLIFPDGSRFLLWNFRGLLKKALCLLRYFPLPS
jgi:hypothetical protein